MESPKKANLKHSKPNSKKDEKSFMRFYALAFEVVVANVLLIVGGYYLDKALVTSPTFIISGTFLSMGFTIWLLVKFSK